MTGLLAHSLQTAAVIILLMLLRKFLLHKLPKVTFQVAWGVVVLRLLLPFSVPVFSADMQGGISRVMDFLAGGSQEADEGKIGGNGKEQTEALKGRGRADLGGNKSASHADNAEDGGGQDSMVDSSIGGNPADGKDSFGNGNILPGSKDGPNDGSRQQKTAAGNEITTGSEPNSHKDNQGNGDSWTFGGGGFGDAYGWQAEDNQNPEVGGNTDASAAQDSAEKAAITRILPIVWLFGACSVLLSFFASHLRARKQYATALPVERTLPEIDFSPVWGRHCRRRKTLRRKITVKTSDRIFAPVTYGIFSPVILLPKTTDWENTAQLRMVLAHEAVHIRRFDILYKYLLAAAAALHWFNPFVWAMYFLANRDIELSCDEAVIRRMQGGAKKDYALALLNYEEKRMFSPTVSGFGGNAVRERIEAIMKINKTSVASMAMAVILVAGTTTVFAGAKESKNPPADGQETLPGKGEDGSENGKASVKQYRCEPAYYTLEEFEELMELERKEITAALKDGSITQENADAAFAEIEKRIEEVRNGKKCEKPSQVFYADGTPVVNSQGGYLYVKASDIERMNAQLREKAAGTQETETAEADNIASAAEGNELLAGKVLQDLPDDFSFAETDFSWYTYAQYQEYAEKQKEEYRSMLGEWGFDSVDGWYEWDAEKIEEACRLLDENLEFIKNGGMISMPGADGDVLMMGLPSETWSMDEREARQGGYAANHAESTTSEGGEFDSELLKNYEVFGVTADEKAGSYLYRGRKIAGIRDEGFLLMDGTAKEENGVYLKGVRENGKLVGLEEITEEEFKKLVLHGVK